MYVLSLSCYVCFFFLIAFFLTFFVFYTLMLASSLVWFSRLILSPFSCSAWIFLLSIVCFAFFLLLLFLFSFVTLPH